MKQSDIWTQIVEPRDLVYARFQPIFAIPALGRLTAEDFKPFLYFEHNHHWTGLHRQVNRLCADLPELRRQLAVLLDPSRPASERLDEVAGTITGFGKGTITAILHVAHPRDFGVWNNTSEGALWEVGLYPELARGASLGTRYVAINAVLVRLAEALQVDLWTLDALWWTLQQGDAMPVGAKISQVPIEPNNRVAQRFGLERHLHDFLFDNWDNLELGREWTIYGAPGDDEAGYEFPCAVGRIDLLAKHRTQKRWLVIELKREDTSDVVVGQVLRYMGWVRQNLATPDEEVHGLIIARACDNALQYAVAVVPNLAFQLYEVEFRLTNPKPAEAAPKA